jgi:hypothetical protein
MHIAVGMIPAVILLGELHSNRTEPLLTISGRLWHVAAAAGIVIAILGTNWAIQRTLHARWMFRTSGALYFAEAAQPQVRSTLASRIAEDSIQYAKRHPYDAGEVWRLVGKSYLVKRDNRAAESAFRHAHALWPHAEAELGIGRSLAAQGRRAEAVPYLANVVRVNRRLIEMVGSDELKQAVNRHLSLRSKPPRKANEG